MGARLPRPPQKMRFIILKVANVLIFISRVGKKIFFYKFSAVKGAGVLAEDG